MTKSKKSKPPIEREFSVCVHASIIGYATVVATSRKEAMDNLRMVDLNMDFFNRCSIVDYEVNGATEA